eukprot:6687718-Alexandrium_andersonii.AAC.1
MQLAIGLGSDGGRSKASNPASDPPTDGCCRMRLTSGASKHLTRTKLWRKASERTSSLPDRGARGPPGGPRRR